MSISNGIYHRSLPSTLLYTLYIIDIEKMVPKYTKIIQYADDIVVYASAKIIIIQLKSIKI